MPTGVWAQETNSQPPTHEAIAHSTQQPAESQSSTPSEKGKTVVIPLPNYGSLMLDWGVNFWGKRPDEMALSLLQSRFINLYVYFNIHLGQSPFVFSLGTGPAFASYYFQTKDKAYYTLVRNSNTQRTEVVKAASTLSHSDKIFQSSLHVRYWDLLGEIRWNAKRKYPKEGLFVALGGKIGIPWRAATTVKYKEYAIDRYHKTHTYTEHFNLNGLRYGLHARLGWGRLGVLYTYIFSRFFDVDKGPAEAPMHPQEVSLSVDLF